MVVVADDTRGAGIIRITVPNWVRRLYAPAGIVVDNVVAVVAEATIRPHNIRNVGIRRVRRS